MSIKDKTPPYINFDEKNHVEELFLEQLDELEPENLMIWFSRKEFDRNAWFYTDADVRGGLSWETFCNIELPVPNIEKQRDCKGIQNHNRPNKTERRTKPKN